MVGIDPGFTHGIGFHRRAGKDSLCIIGKMQACSFQRCAKT